MSNPDHQLSGFYKALMKPSPEEDLKVVKLPTPQPTPGSVIVRILSACIISYASDAYGGRRGHTFPTPLVIGSNAIGRVAAVGEDATMLKPGQLVLVDSFIRSRDNTDDAFLHGLFEGVSEGSKKLMREVWRDSTYGEYCRMPLENCEPLNEERLMAPKKGVGYTTDELCLLLPMQVPYGGLRSIDLKAGETIIVAPATGQFGGAAVHVALAMGARVIAMGRDTKKLEKLKQISDRVEIVPITNNQEEEMKALRAFGPIDAFFDISPAVAIDSTHIKSAIMSLVKEGRVSLMGGFRADISIPFRYIMHNNIRIKGKWMYERSDVKDLIKMLENGLLRLGEAAGMRICGTWPLEQWREAFDGAAVGGGNGELAIFHP